MRGAVRQRWDPSTPLGCASLRSRGHAVLAQPQAAVDGHDLAGDEMRGGREKLHGLGNLFAGAISAHRGLASHASHERFGLLLTEIDHSGGHCVHGNLGGQSLSHHLGQHMESGFRRAIVRMSWPRQQSAQRTHIDDLAATLAKSWQCFTRYQKRPAGIRGKDRVPLLQADAFKLDGFVVRGIVDKDVDPAERAHRFLNCGLNAPLVGDIAPQSESPQADGSQIDHGVLGFTSRVVEGDSHVGTRPRQRQRTRPPQPFRTPRYQHGLAQQRGLNTLSHGWDCSASVRISRLAKGFLPLLFWTRANVILSEQWQPRRETSYYLSIQGKRLSDCRGATWYVP